METPYQAPFDAPEWDRHNGESAPAFEAFVMYRDMFESRSQRGAAEKLGKSTALICKWAARHEWTKRVQAYDAYRDRVRREADEKALAARARRWANTREEHREKALELGRGLLDKAAQMLKFPLQTVERTESVDGKAVTTVIQPTKWGMSDIPRFIETADKVIRLAAEMETDRHRIDHTLIREEVKPYADELGMSVEDFIAEAEALLSKR